LLTHARALITTDIAYGPFAVKRRVHVRCTHPVIWLYGGCMLPICRQIFDNIHTQPIAEVSFSTPECRFSTNITVTVAVRPAERKLCRCKRVTGTTNPHVGMSGPRPVLLAMVSCTSDGPTVARSSLRVHTPFTTPNPRKLISKQLSRSCQSRDTVAAR
jgi:hypothetical protein